MLEMITNQIASLLQDPTVRARMALMGNLENEMHSYGVRLGELYTDGISSEGDVRLAIRAQVHVLADAHDLTLYERDYLAQAAHRVSGVLQY